ncbi:hypothetical protein PybrP1_003757 [[Pythium] brassicae (nom. inval.)]|nr:hypothetical protein PybrP1_003757 [[Pythium] brassicae (nom. inval.)]
MSQRIERVREQIALLQRELEDVGHVADVITELPRKLSHHVMRLQVPLGKRAMMPGKIVRSNEILAHLGDDYFAWQSAASAVETIERRKKNIAQRIKEAESAAAELSEKKSQVDSLFDIKKLYEAENIREIQESEEESNKPVPRAADEDIEQFFEIEEEERRKEEQVAWNWDDTMRRIEELEAREEGGAFGDEDEEKAATAPAKDAGSNIAAKAAELKAQGNSAFAKRRFAESVTLYSRALELEPSSHILYGNRSAAYHRLKKHAEALEDANFAVALDDSWVKGHYRKACALASLERFREAAEAFERAFELCPTDDKLDEKAREMRAKLVAAAPQPRPAVPQLKQPVPQDQSRAVPAPAHSSFTDASKVSTSGVSIPTTIPAPAFASSSASFSGEIMEREIIERAPVASSAPAGGAAVRVAGAGAGAAPIRSRFAGNNPKGDVVTFEPVGEAQPVKRVSRFKAARSGQ